MRWNGASLTVDGHEFIAATFTAAASKPGRLVMWKDRSLVEAVAKVLDDTAPERVFELGIALGGSTGFIAAYASPRKLLAIDYSTERVEALDDFVRTAGLEDSVTTVYGVDQADVGRLRELAAQEFGDAPLDLVLDDASHRLDETRVSFETLFPLLRPGGVYAIEDWQWGLVPLDPTKRQEKPDFFSFWPTGQSLALLPMELTLAAPTPTHV